MKARKTAEDIDLHASRFRKAAKGAAKRAVGGTPPSLPECANRVEARSLMRGDRPRIWMIYAHDNAEQAGDLVSKLRCDGVDAQWDRDLPPGVDYDVQIELAIRSCDRAIVIWSEQASCSRFVLDEATLALELDKLVPVHVPGYDIAELRLRFRRVQSLSTEDYPMLLQTLVGPAAGRA